MIIVLDAIRRNGQYIFGIIVTCNRFLKRPETLIKYDCENNIEKDTLNHKLDNFCLKLNNSKNTYDICNGCLLDGTKKYDRWCSCTLLIYLNKSLLGIWRDEA